MSIHKKGGCMKKILAISLFLLLVASQAWGTLATVTATEWGYSITGGTSTTLIVQDTWATATAYTLGQRVIVSGIIYQCQIAHTSGTFATDLAASDWVVVQYATLWVSSIGQYASTATDAAWITSGLSSGVSSGVSAFSILNTTCLDFSDVNGVQLINPRIQLKAATDVVYIRVKRSNF
jgi:hypothetical protein